jgi:hypothetical protein
VDEDAFMTYDEEELEERRAAPLVVDPPEITHVASSGLAPVPEKKESMDM